MSLVGTVFFIFPIVLALFCSLMEIAFAPSSRAYITAHSHTAVALANHAFVVIYDVKVLAVNAG